jgi:hypothetical protein
VLNVGIPVSFHLRWYGTFRSAACASGYVTWGNYATYWLEDPLPGIARSETPARLKILHDTITALPYWEMEPSNEVVSVDEITMEDDACRTNFCLAKSGEAYMIFSLQGGDLTVTLADGDYGVTQLDPRTGKETDLGRVSGGEQALTVAGTEQVLVIRK